MARLVSTMRPLRRCIRIRKLSDSELRLLQDQATRQVHAIAAMSDPSYFWISLYHPARLTYTENFMNMLWKMVRAENTCRIPVLARSARHSFYCTADSRTKLQHERHECRRKDPRRPNLASLGAAALSGPLHGCGERRSAAHADEIGPKDHRQCPT